MIYIHIGLPKTATTSLQYTFRSISNIFYTGVIQPRNSIQKSVFLKLTSWINDIDDLSSNKRDDLIEMILLELHEHQHILFSEEMFSIDQGILTWQKKLERLYSLLVGIKSEFKIIVTIREPVMATYSLYVELYKEVKENYPNFNDFFYKSNQAKIYQYKYLYEFLTNNFGENNLIFIPFEEIVGNNKIYLNKFFTDIDWGRNKYILLEKTNSKKKVAIDGYYTESKSLDQYIPKIFLAIFKKKLRYKILNALSTIKIPYTSKKICFSKNEEYQQKLCEDIIYFESKTGINYLK